MLIVVKMANMASFYVSKFFYDFRVCGSLKLERADEIQIGFSLYPRDYPRVELFRGADQVAEYPAEIGKLFRF